jgi:endonuclease IV
MEDDEKELGKNAPTTVLLMHLKGLTWDKGENQELHLCIGTGMLNKIS